MIKQRGLQLLKNINWICKQNYKKNMKQQPFQESYVVTQENKVESKINDIEIEIKKYNVDGAPERGLRGEKAIPISPKLGPIIVEKPTIASKKYRWCSCGRSLKQPFCDGSHKGTPFHGVRFTIEEAVDKIELCGCKFTKNAPFCDGTCAKLCEQIEIQEDEIVEGEESNGKQQN